MTSMLPSNTKISPTCRTRQRNGTRTRSIRPVYDASIRGKEILIEEEIKQALRRVLNNNEIIPQPRVFRIQEQRCSGDAGCGN